MLESKTNERNEARKIVITSLLSLNPEEYPEGVAIWVFRYREAMIKSIRGEQIMVELIENQEV